MVQKKQWKKHSAGVLVLLAGWYYVSFLNGASDTSFSAEDLVVKTIDTKESYEKILVESAYDKILDSCKKPDPYRNFYPRWGISDGRFSDGETAEFSMWERRQDAPRGINFGNGRGDDRLKWASNATSISDSISVPSLSFDGNSPKPAETLGNVGFSQTNIQKQNVDEWDLLKQTKEHVFYYSKNASKIFVIKSPMNGERLDLSSVRTVFEISIPNEAGIKPELFVNDSRLVYVSSKKSYDNNDTVVWVYDISNLKNGVVTMVKTFQTKGEYFQSRLIGNDLYLVSDYSLQPIRNKYCNMLKNSESDAVDFLRFFTGINFRWFGRNEELYADLRNELESYSYDFAGETSLAASGTARPLKAFRAFYTEKDLKEPIENLNYNVLSIIDIDKKDGSDTQSLFFWNLKGGEMHMTTENLYLVNSYYRKEQWKCEFVDICHKQFASNNFTSIAKISHTGKDVRYVKSAVIEGRPINQYSMDEDEGYFRIFTALWNGNRDAALSTFDKNFRRIGGLENIRPGEEFKSARFIGDKAFLVTFRQTDPLFVIDLHVHSDPKIIGELHIPGFSSYLHPYGKMGNRDYLVGIGKNQRSTKVDLYEIDYDKKDSSGKIAVSQKHVFVFPGRTSDSPAENNPRAFVFDTKDKTLYLPIQIYGDEWTGGEMFTGIKILKIDVAEGIRETASHSVANAKYILDARTGYYSDGTETSPFFAGENGISFFQGTEAKAIGF